MSLKGDHGKGDRERTWGRTNGFALHTRRRTVRWQARWTLGQQKDRKFVKEREGGEVRAKERGGTALFMTRVGLGVGGRGQKAPRRRVVGKAPRTASALKVGSVDFRGAIDTELADQSQESRRGRGELPLQGKSV